MSVPNNAQRKRLMALANYLETVIKTDRRRLKKLDMRSYCDKNECGTTYCAAGFATFIPQFKKAGFKLVNETDYNGSIIKDFKTVVFYDQEGLEACKSFFGVSEPFDPWSGLYRNVSREPNIDDVIYQLRRAARPGLKKDEMR